MTNCQFARLTRTSGHGLRSSGSSSDVRLCLRRFVAVDVLGRLDCCWSLACIRDFPARDLWTSHPEEESKTHAQGV